MYENTDARSHRMAAGADRGRGGRQRHLSPPLRARADREAQAARARPRARSSCVDDGRLAVTYISAEDYAATGASEALTEGVIDHLRTIDGTAVAAVVRDQSESGRAARKVSMRSTDGGSTSRRSRACTAAAGTAAPPASAPTCPTSRSLSSCRRDQLAARELSVAEGSRPPPGAAGRQAGRRHLPRRRRRDPPRARR